MNAGSVRKLLFTADTPEGRLLVLDAGVGLRFIVDTSPKSIQADGLIDEADITRFRMKSTAPEISVRALAAHLEQWLARRDSRTAVYRLTIMPEACIGDDAVVVSGSASPPVLLNYGDSAGLRRAISGWLAGDPR
jgi:hypothetical protein